MIAALIAALLAVLNLGIYIGHRLPRNTKENP